MDGFWYVINRANLMDESWNIFFKKIMMEPHFSRSYCLRVTGRFSISLGFTNSKR